LGTFVSVDPLVTITGEAYIYGSANPVSYSDPSGLFSCFVPDDPSKCQGDLESTWSDSGTGAGTWYSNGAGSHLVTTNQSIVSPVTSPADHRRSNTPV
jgi:hypothetical protein